ncbi:helix-turn-helix domain-containing protein [Deinococcus sp. S9]|uniref:helix-turn-helix domain-containing protein n=1 Tax=Deinococcus sp. S9 TaxID=2545754 RepID=UPI0021103270|nr:helix-turn-helix transcriptional regulator [Deinococcus sp. S9]
MTPPARSQKPAWALAFKRRREEMVGSQEELAARADVSQSLISQIERGVQLPTGVSMDRFARLLEALHWTPEQFAEATGLEVPFVAPSRSGPPVPPVVPRRETPVVIPPELQQVIDDYGDTYPELRDPTIQKIIAAPRNFGGPENGPQTAQEWLEYFLLTRRYLR